MQQETNADCCVHSTCVKVGSEHGHAEVKSEVGCDLRACGHWALISVARAGCRPGLLL